MKNPVIYVVLNGELKMSPGKAAAQAVHAAMLLSSSSKADFVSDYKRTVIVLEAKNSRQLQNLYNYLDTAGVDCDYYIDEGANEVDAFSATALAAFVGDDPELREIFLSFPIYNGHIEIKHVDRWGETKHKIALRGGVTIESGIAYRALKKACVE